MRPEHMSERDDWRTPPEIARWWIERYHLSVDVAATDEGVCGLAHYGPGGEREDGLDGAPWGWPGHGCWMNPPYGRGKTGRWAMEAARQAREYGVVVVGLLPARPATGWWHVAVTGQAAEVHFARHRIRFVGAASGAPFPSAFVVWRPHAARSPLVTMGWWLEVGDDAGA